MVYLKLQNAAAANTSLSAPRIHCFSPDKKKHGKRHADVSFVTTDVLLIVTLIKPNDMNSVFFWLNLCELINQIRKMFRRHVELRAHWRKLKAFVKVKSSPLTWLWKASLVNTGVLIADIRKLAHVAPI